MQKLYHHAFSFPWLLAASLTLCTSWPEEWQLPHPSHCLAGDTNSLCITCNGNIFLNSHVAQKLFKGNHHLLIILTTYQPSLLHSYSFTYGCSM